MVDGRGEGTVNLEQEARGASSMKGKFAAPGQESLDPESSCLEIQLPQQQALRTAPVREVKLTMGGPRLTTFLLGVIVGFGLGVALVLNFK